MSGTSSHESAEAHGPHSVPFYLAIFGILTALTCIELGPLFGWFNIPIPGLLVLSAIKFVIVAAVFMHLMDDHAFFTQVFGAPLVFAILMVCVLISLAYNWNPAPKVLAAGSTYAVNGDPMVIQERYWDRYSGECSSWVVSHASHRSYCASPEIDQKRLAREMVPLKAAGAAAAPALDLSGLSEDEAKAKLVELGKTLYEGKAGCVACHQATGAGVPGAFPPLAGSDSEHFTDPVAHARTIIHGLTGKITVNGTEYNGAMTPFGDKLTDTEIAAVATYERNSWGNDHGIVTPEQVAAAR